MSDVHPFFSKIMNNYFFLKKNEDRRKCYKSNRNFRNSVEGKVGLLFSHVNTHEYPRIHFFFFLIRTRERGRGLGRGPLVRILLPVFEREN